MVTTASTYRMTTNKGGGPSYPAGVLETAYRYLVTGMMGGTYYSTAEQIDEEAIALFEAALEQDEEMFAKMIVYAREQGLTRRAPIAALVVLTKATDKTLAYKAAKRVLVTPGDLADFIGFTENPTTRPVERYNKRTKTVEYAQQMTEGATKALKIRGQGRTVTRIVAERLQALTPYHVIKYGSASQTISLRDMYRIGHPATVTDAQQAMAAYVVKGHITPALDGQIQGYIAFKQAANDGKTAEALALVGAHKLPWEVVTGQLGGKADKKTIWSTMLRQMPYMALLRNLRNLLSNNVLDDDANLKYVTETLTNPERVKRSKQFPFAFYQAIQAVRGATYTTYSSAQGEVIRALETALDLSVSNIPALGKALIANDVSPSMMAPAKTSKGNGEPLTCMDIAALGAAACYKASPESVAVSFDATLYQRSSLSREWGVTTLMSKMKVANMGGTALWLPVQHMLQNHAVTFDTFVGFTDDESWFGERESWGHSGTGTKTQALLAQYRRERNPYLRAYLVQLTPTSARPTSAEDSLTQYIAGWSNDVFNFIGLDREVGTGQLDKIRDMVLD